MQNVHINPLAFDDNYLKTVKSCDLNELYHLGQLHYVAAVSSGYYQDGLDWLDLVIRARAIIAERFNYCSKHEWFYNRLCSEYDNLHNYISESLLRGEPAYDYQFTMAHLINDALKAGLFVNSYNCLNFTLVY